MLETPHVVIGAAIATQIPNPFISIPLALASHFVLDKIPHWNPHFYTETQKLGKPSLRSTRFAIADEVIALGVGIFIASRVLPDSAHFVAILFACFASVLPDQVKVPYFFFKSRKDLITRWVKFERSLQVEVEPVWGILAQIAVIAAGLWWIFLS